MNKFARTTRVACVAALAAALATTAPLASAHKVKLTGAQETPAVTTKASGRSMIMVHKDKTVTGHVMYKGMTATAAHIHEGAMGVSGPPIITLTKESDTKFSVPADAKLTDEQYASYKAGKLYVNVHSAEHPDGEIRAQLK